MSDAASRPRSRLKGARLLMVSIAIVGYMIDQVTKNWAELALGGTVIPVIGDWLTLQLFYNPGAAFSMGTQFTVVLSILSLVVFLVLVGVVFWRVRTYLYAVVVGCLLFGVAGNLTDRLFREPAPFLGHVVDFISVKGFAIFNVADIGITVAAGLMIIGTLLGDRIEAKASSGEAPVEAANDALATPSVDATSETPAAADESDADHSTGTPS